MKQYMNISANDKMVDHIIFWDNVKNGITIGMLFGLAYLIKLLFQSLNLLF